MKWKKLLLPLTGAMVGLAAVASRKRKRKKELQPRLLPRDAELIRIFTETRRVSFRGQPYLSRAEYSCRPTQFRVWSLLDAGSQADAKKGRPGSVIHLVSPVIEFQAESGGDRETVPEEKFYATIHHRPENKWKTLPDHVAKGAPVEFHKCHVGGSMNGVETGDRIVTEAAVADIEVVGGSQ